MRELVRVLSDLECPGGAGPAEECGSKGRRGPGKWL